MRFLFHFLSPLFILRSIAICMSVLGCLYFQSFALPKSGHHRELIPVPFSTVSSCLTYYGRKSPWTFFGSQAHKAHEGFTCKYQLTGFRNSRALKCVPALVSFAAATQKNN